MVLLQNWFCSKPKKNNCEIVLKPVCLKPFWLCFAVRPEFILDFLGIKPVWCCKLVCQTVQLQNRRLYCFFCKTSLNSKWFCKLEKWFYSKKQNHFEAQIGRDSQNGLPNRFENKMVLQKKQYNLRFCTIWQTSLQHQNGLTPKKSSLNSGLRFRTFGVRHYITFIIL